MIDALQKINGKIEMIEDLQIKGLDLSLDQQFHLNKREREIV